MLDTKEAKADTNYVIKCFEWADIERHFDEICDMQLENIYKFHYPQKKPDRDYVKRKILEIKKHLENKNTFFVGATIGDRLCGYIWCYEGIFIDEKSMFINALFVCEEVRGSCLGQLLMNEVKRIAVDNDCDSISTHYAVFNTVAGKFYDKNRFNPIRVETVCRLK